MKNSILKLSNVESLNSAELKEIKGGIGERVQIIEHYCCLSPDDPRAANQQGAHDPVACGHRLLRYASC